MDILPIQSFRIFVGNVFNWQVCLPKRMIIAQCEIPSDGIQAVDFNNQNDFPIAASKINSSPSNSSAALHFNFWAVRYNPAKEKQLQMLRHTITQNENILRFAEDKRHKAHLPYKNFCLL